jgi:uncharacterized protein (TIGR03083 family)
MQLAGDERKSFAALLEGLTPQQWEFPTPCEQWRVRAVVAHTISYEELTRPQLVARPNISE